MSGSQVRGEWRGTARRLGKILIAVAVSVIVVALVLGAWLAFPANDRNVRCDATVPDLPKVIPDRLIVVVVNEDGGRLVGDVRITVEMALQSGLAVYDFADHVLPSFEDLPPAEVGDHVMELKVFITREIPGIQGIGGQMCGDSVEVRLTDNPRPEVLRLRFIHEFGHYFGLPHEAGTYMREGDLRPDPMSDRFNAWQLDVLSRWNTPVAQYVPHWERRASLLPVAMAVVAVFLLALWTAKFVRSRRGRTPGQPFDHKDRGEDRESERERRPGPQAHGEKDGGREDDLLGNA